MKMWKLRFGKYLKNWLIQFGKCPKKEYKNYWIWGGKGDWLMKGDDHPVDIFVPGNGWTAFPDEEYFRQTSIVAFHCISISKEEAAMWMYENAP